MPWTYSQSTGRLMRGSIVVGTGYSGHRTLEVVP